MRIGPLTRRDFLKSSLAAAALGAGGCIREEAVEPGKIRLHFYTYATPEFITLFDKSFTPAFVKRNPHIDVKVNNSMGDAGYDAKLLTLIAGKLPPDVIHVTQVNFPQYAAKGLLLPLDEFLTNDPEIHESDFYTSLMDGMRFDGKLYGLPSDFSTIVMFFNQDLFDKFGVAYPKDDWTWDDYLEKARVLTRDTDGDGHTDVFGTMNTNNYNRWPAWVWMNGGDLFTPDHARCTIDDPKSVGGLQFYVDLCLKHRVAPTPAQTLAQDMDKLFASQIVAMVPNSRYPYKQYLHSRTLPFRWDLAPMPRGPAGRATTFIFGGNCILRSSKYPKESWEFVKFMSGPIGAAINLECGNALPPYKKAAEQEIAHPNNPLLPKNDRCFVDAVPYARIPFAPAQFADYNQALAPLQDAFLGLRPVDEVCRQCAREANEAFAAGVA